VDLSSATQEWQTHGFVILPGFIPAAELKPALDELSALYPTAEGFHDGTDGRRDRFTVDEWAGINSVDVPAELGAPSMVSRTRTTGLPAKPNWYPREDGADCEGGWVATAGSPDLYDAEVRAAGPAGTVVAWATGTFHRGTALTLPRGARYTLQLGYRPARAEWASGCPGSTAATNPSGTSSCTGRHHDSSRSSASRRPVTRTGPKPPSPARRNGTPG
jgi:hypothetical protein